VNDDTQKRESVTNALIFETLNAVQAGQTKQSDDLLEIKGRLGIIEQQYASLSGRLDRLDDRVARIGRRLELSPA